MKFEKRKLKGLYLITPDLKRDERGHFTRIFCEKELAEKGIDFRVRQINKSLNRKKGIIRGMHFQKKPKEEDKIVQCLKGAVYDVVIDLRKDSSTYGQWLAEELTAKNQRMLFIPKGLAHGFQTLTNDCEMLYSMSEFYSPQAVNGVRWDDPFFKIKWPIANPVLSDKDKKWPLVTNEIK